MVRLSALGYEKHFSFRVWDMRFRQMNGSSVTQ